MGRRRDCLTRSKQLRKLHSKIVIMKLHVALFFAGLFGALATLFILLSFGTDYWLLASETCNSHVNGPATLQVGGSVVSIPLGQREKWTSVLLI